MYYFNFISDWCVFNGCDHKKKKKGVLNNELIRVGSEICFAAVQTDDYYVSVAVTEFNKFLA